MKKMIFVLLLLSSYVSNSQKIIWEKEKKFDFIISTSTNPCFVNSNGNIVNIIESTSYYISQSYFFMCDLSGNFSETKVLFEPLMIKKTGLRIPILCHEVNLGYRIFGATSSEPALINSEHLLPIIINLDDKGDTTTVAVPYDLNTDNNYIEHNIVMSSIFINTITVGNKYYNGYINNWVKVKENEYIENQHIIVSC
ncbi:MAG: hypothetical protein Q8M94_15170, partial [Ignavibacteria bacterium]|nr:hypothetical protein [Ignavibacteria bacterium]